MPNLKKMMIAGVEYKFKDTSKVNAPATDGTNGQLLRTNGDGTTSWVDEGTPTAEQIQTAVDGWLDDHPEATTTVEDGSITYAKLDTNLKGHADAVAPTEASTTASKAYAVGDHFFYNGVLYEVTTAIAVSGTIVTSGTGVNVKVVSNVSDDLSDLKSTTSAIEDEVYEDVIAPSHDSISNPETKTKRSIASNGDISSTIYSNNVVSAYTIPNDAKEITVEGFPGSTNRYCAFYTSSDIASSSSLTCIGAPTEYNPTQSTILSVPSNAVIFALRWDTASATADIGNVYVTKKTGKASKIEVLEETVDSFGTPTYIASVPSNTPIIAYGSTSGKYISYYGIVASSSDTHSIVSGYSIPDGTAEICLKNYPLKMNGSAAVAFSSSDPYAASGWLGTAAFKLGTYDNYIPVPDGAKTMVVRWYDDNGTIGEAIQTYKNQVHAKLDDFQTDYYLFNTVFEVGVGAGADYATLNDAITAASKKYPAYRKGGITCEILIKSGTVINEQIAVVGMDLSYITITSEDAWVGVNVDGFNDQGMNKHDLRGPNVGAFIGGENGAGLPKVGTIFKVVQNTDNVDVVGYFANRSSKGVVLSGCGFDGFGDGCISNNESSITIREGIARNNKRYGVHARHNGEVSARSCNCTNNGTYGAYADRVANLDVREADVGGSDVGVCAGHASNVCACATHADGCRIVAQATTCAVIDCSFLTSAGATESVFVVQSGGIMNCVSAAITDTEAPETNIDKNTLTANGIIWG